MAIQLCKYIIVGQHLKEHFLILFGTLSLPARRRWNRNIDLFHRAERRKRLIELLRVADHKRRELVGVEVLCRDSIRVGSCYFLDFRFGAVEPVRGYP